MRSNCTDRRDEQAGQRLLEADLDLTSQCLKRNPKEYAVWEHRKWVLRTMPDPDWRFELRTVEGLLEKDARNCRSCSSSWTLVEVAHSPRLGLQAVHCSCAQARSGTSSLLDAKEAEAYNSF